MSSAADLAALVVVAGGFPHRTMVSAGLVHVAAARATGVQEVFRIMSM